MIAQVNTMNRIAVERRTHKSIMVAGAFQVSKGKWEFYTVILL